MGEYSLRSTKTMGDRRKSNDKENSAQASQVSDKQASLDSIQNSITDLHRKFDGLKTTQKQCNASIKNNSAVIKELNSRYDAIKEENGQLKSEMNLLKAVVSKQASDIDNLKRDLLDQQTRQMRDNVLFHQVPESKNEDCEKKIKDILSENGYAGEITVDRIHRIGRYEANATKPRPIVAKLLSSSQVDSLLKFGREKKDKLKVTPQFPTELRAKRQQLGEVAESARKKGNDVKTKIVSDTLFINGERYVDDLPRPSPRDMLFMNDAEKKAATEVKFEEVSAKLDNSTFIVRAARVHSLNDCRSMYKSLLWNPNNMAATHNTAAYRLFSPEGARITDGYNDDGEHGMGKVVRDTLHRLDSKNVIVFVTRFYGGKNLGQKRFELVKDLVKRVSENLNRKK